jgi:hypothetical protein
MPRPFHMRFRVLSAVVLSAVIARPQNPPGPGQPEISSEDTPVSFSSRVNLVSVPVIVRDREGHAVGNLTQEDFQLYDKGKLQTITKFTVEKSEVRTAAPESQGGPLRRTVAPVPSGPDFPERYIAYLVDDIHLTSGVLLNTREAMKRHLDESLDASSRAAIFTTAALFSPISPMTGRNCTVRWTASCLGRTPRTAFARRSPTIWPTW